MNRERWDEIKALHVEPQRQEVPTGGRLKRRTPKVRRPSGIAKHFAAQRRQEKH